MRWMSFARNGTPSFGPVIGDGVADAAARSDFATLKDAIAADALAQLGETLRSADHGLGEIDYLPPIANPDKILCVGLNYRAHQAETGRGGEAHPTLFTRFASSQVGHLQPMVRPRESATLDYEGEIALVIGKPGRRIAAADWRRHIAGFSCYNDGSVREYQRHTSQFTPGKNFDASGAFGPWLMTPDAVGDPDAIAVTTRLNGETMQSATAAQMVFGFADLVAYCSAFAALAPGDVIVTGTPGGVGAARTPPVFMDEGDTVEVRIDPIGTLRNPIVRG